MGTQGGRPREVDPRHLFFQLRLSFLLHAELPLSRWPAQKRKACSPLEPRQPRRNDPPSPTRWELARTKVKGKFKDCLSPPLDNEADLPVEPPSSRRLDLPEDMERVNIGITNEGGVRSTLVLTLLHQGLYQQVHMATRVDSDTCHRLLRSTFGPNYGLLVPGLTSAVLGFGSASSDGAGWGVGEGDTGPSPPRASRSL